MDTNQFAIDEVCKHFGVCPHDLTGAPSPTYSTLPMIEQLVRKRIKAIVDGLVSEPVVMGADMAAEYAESLAT